MMATLLVIRGRIQHYFERNYRLIRGILKGLVVLLALLLLTARFPEGYFSDKQWVFLIIAAVCGFSPDVVSIGAVSAVVGIETWRVSPIFTVTIFLTILIFFLLFGRKAKEQWYILLAVPVLSALQMGFLVPVVAALFVGPAMLPSLVMGILLRFSLEGVTEYTATAQRVTDSSNPFSPFKYLVDYLVDSRLLMVALIVYVLTFIVIYLIRRTSFRFAPQIAILTGCIVLYTLEMISNIVWELELNLWLTSLLVVLTMGIAYLIQFFRLSLDYHGTRRLQFEDDEYYYYVKAIPKYNVAASTKEITKIVTEETEEEKPEGEETGE